MDAKNKLIVALDIDNFDRAVEIVDILSPEVEIFKIGIAPFTNFGGAILEKLRSAGKKIFLDLKFHDIPNTVRDAARAAAAKGVFMMNFHCLGGLRMLEAAVKGAGEIRAEGAERQPGASACGSPILLGVTILTSMSREDMRDAGLGGEVQKRVIKLARLAADAGLDGVVASAKEAREIKKKIGKDFVIVAPGIRPAWAQAGDQKRILTPAEAVSEGADYIVVGRPIIQADDPVLAAKRIIEEMRL
ncbi:MAG: orotidine-5'-phosphate decarboxylase [Candidatus Makaraimicrobium thalassicum]|nr:MAG: orotidine-5'-phosphate decarboxylase [Candidatus Omnitrophota bacterium]